MVAACSDQPWALGAMWPAAQHQPRVFTRADYCLPTSRCGKTTSSHLEKCRWRIPWGEQDPGRQAWMERHAGWALAGRRREVTGLVFEELHLPGGDGLSAGGPLQSGGLKAKLRQTAPRPPSFGTCQPCPPPVPVNKPQPRGWLSGEWGNTHCVRVRARVEAFGALHHGRPSRDGERCSPNACPIQQSPLGNDGARDGSMDVA